MITQDRIQVLISMCERYGITCDDLVSGVTTKVTPQRLLTAGIGKSYTTTHAGQPPTDHMVLAHVAKSILMRGYFTPDGVPALLLDLFKALDIPIERVVSVLSELCMNNARHAGNIVMLNTTHITQQEGETPNQFELRKALNAIGEHLTYEVIATLVLESATLKQLATAQGKAA